MSKVIVIALVAMAVSPLAFAAQDESAMPQGPAVAQTGKQPDVLPDTLPDHAPAAKNHKRKKFLHQAPTAGSAGIPAASAPGATLPPPPRETVPPPASTAPWPYAPPPLSGLGGTPPPASPSD